jgi:hypothetical protein
MAIETTMFSGVNVGYSDASITTHAQALELVNKTLSFIRRSGVNDQSNYTTYPAYVVYDTALSCPEGGELAVAVTSSGGLNDVSATAEQLRAKLKQSSLSVAAEPETGATTHGLRIETKGDLAALAKLWQKKAADVKNETISTDNPHGTYVSVGMYDAGNGNIVIQGEANPRYYPTDESKQQWQQAAIKVATTMSAELKQELNPSFREVGFSYLRAKDMANSRGEAF